MPPVHQAASCPSSAHGSAVPYPRHLQGSPPHLIAIRRSDASVSHQTGSHRDWGLLSATSGAQMPPAEKQALEQRADRWVRRQAAPGTRAAGSLFLSLGPGPVGSHPPHPSTGRDVEGRWKRVPSPGPSLHLPRGWGSRRRLRPGSATLAASCFHRPSLLKGAYVFCAKDVPSPPAPPPTSKRAWQVPRWWPQRVRLGDRPAILPGAAWDSAGCRCGSSTSKSW